MTPLRQRFIEDLGLRNRSPKTVSVYVQRLCEVAGFYSLSPDRLSAEQIHRYLVHLVQEKQVSWAVYNQTVSALRFFFRVTCPSDIGVSRIPFAKKPKRVPVIPTPDEVARLLAGVRSQVIRMLLRTIYAAGLRLGEALYLRAEHIDSTRMVLRIFGKGQKERLVPLAPRLLDDLRRYWHETRPGEWLFPRKRGKLPPHPSTIQRACTLAARAAGLRGRITPHTLRHCYATHLLEAGSQLPTIQALLGHSRISTTAGYVHVTAAGLQKVISPLDLLPQPQVKKQMPSSHLETNG